MFRACCGWVGIWWLLLLVLDLLICCFDFVGVGSDLGCIVAVSVGFCWLFGYCAVY